MLGDLGIRTFGDLHYDDRRSGLTPARSFRAVVTASNLARQQLLYLPWDLPDYGVDADEFPVARAVRASAAIPFIFEPVRLRSRYGVSSLADGGLLSNYPIEIFDRTDGRARRWPTSGVRLSSPSNEHVPAQPVRGPVSLALSLINTTIDTTQVRHIRHLENVDRTIFTMPRGVRWTDFDVTAEQLQHLYDTGYAAGRTWLTERRRLDPPTTANELE